MRYMKNYWTGTFNYSGRIPRAEFWGGYLGNLLMLLLAIVVLPFVVGIASAIGDFDDEIGFAIVTTLWVLFAVWFFVAGLAAKVRRLHDTNTSGWWVIVLYIPLGHFIPLILLLSKTEITRELLVDQEKIDNHLKSFFENQLTADLPQLLRSVLARRKYVDDSWAVYFSGDDKDEIDEDIFAMPITEDHVVVENVNNTVSGQYVYIGLERFITGLYECVNEALKNEELKDTHTVSVLLNQVIKQAGIKDAEMSGATEIKRLLLVDQGDIDDHLIAFFDSRIVTGFKAVLRSILAHQKFEELSWSVYFSGDDKDENGEYLFALPISEGYVIVEYQFDSRSSEYVYITLETYIEGLSEGVDEWENATGGDVNGTRVLLDQVKKQVGLKGPNVNIVTDIQRDLLVDQEEIENHLKAFFHSQRTSDLPQLLRAVLARRKYVDDSWAVYFSGDESDKNSFEMTMAEDHVVIEDVSYDVSGEYVDIGFEDFVTRLAERVNDWGEATVADVTGVHVLLDQVEKQAGLNISDDNSVPVQRVNATAINRSEFDGFDLHQRFKFSPIVFSGNESDDYTGLGARTVYRDENSDYSLEMSLLENDSIYVKIDGDLSRNEKDLFASVQLRNVKSLVWANKDWLIIRTADQQLNVCFEIEGYSMTLESL